MSLRTCAPGAAVPNWVMCDDCHQRNAVRASRHRWLCRPCWLAARRARQERRAARQEEA